MQPRIRLVKGAYAEPIDLALRSKKEITAQYRYLTDWLFVHGSLPAFGTHDGTCIEYAKKAAVRAGVGKRDFEIQMLYGIRRDLQQQLADDGYRVAGLHPVRLVLVPVPDAADGRTTREPAVLPALAGRWLSPTQQVTHPRRSLRMDAVTNVPQPINEPVHDYAPGSPEREELTARLKQMAAERVELTMAIGGEHRLGGGEHIDVVQPHQP